MPKNAKKTTPGKPKQCAGISVASGKQCKRNASKGSKYCKFHVPIPKIDVGGRTRVKFDPDDVVACGEAGSSFREMAAQFSVSNSTIERRMADKKSTFRRLYEKGFGRQNRKLRSTQVDQAIAGNTTMLIWLGKQRLEQSDKQEVDMRTRIEMRDFARKVADDADLMPEDLFADQDDDLDSLADND